MVQCEYCHGGKTLKNRLFLSGLFLSSIVVFSAGPASADGSSKLRTTMDFRSCVLEKSSQYKKMIPNRRQREKYAGTECRREMGLAPSSSTQTASQPKQTSKDNGYPKVTRWRCYVNSDNERGCTQF